MPLSLMDDSEGHLWKKHQTWRALYSWPTDTSKQHSLFEHVNLRSQNMYSHYTQSVRWHSLPMNSCIMSGSPTIDFVWASGEEPCAHPCALPSNCTCTTLFENARFVTSSWHDPRFRKYCTRLGCMHFKHTVCMHGQEQDCKWLIAYLQVFMNPHLGVGKGLKKISMPAFVSVCRERWRGNAQYVFRTVPNWELI